MKDVMVAERVEMTVAFEAAGQAAQARATLDDGDVGEAGARERIRRRHAGQPAAEHDDRWARHR